MSAPVSMAKIAMAKQVHHQPNWRQVPFGPDDDGPHRIYTSAAFEDLLKGRDLSRFPLWAPERAIDAARALLAGRDLPDDAVFEIFGQSPATECLSSGPLLRRQLIAGLVGAGRGALALQVSLDCQTLASAAARMMDLRTLRVALSRGVPDARAQALYSPAAVAVSNDMTPGELLALLAVALDRAGHHSRAGIIRACCRACGVANPPAGLHWASVVNAYPDLAVEALRHELALFVPGPTTHWAIQEGGFTAESINHLIETLPSGSGFWREVLAGELARRELGHAVAGAGPGLLMP